VGPKGSTARSKARVIPDLMELAGAIADAHVVLANHNGGTFQQWCRVRIGVSPKHAYRLLEIHRTFAGCNIDVTTFEQGSLLHLASPDVGDDVREKCVEFSDEGAVRNQGSSRSGAHRFYKPDLSTGQQTGIEVLCQPDKS
jgi:hypothetical protein